jgi:CheY-like chemotaxis protein
VGLRHCTGVSVAVHQSRMKAQDLLVIEDDSSIRESLHSVFSDEGYQVTCAENGKQGLEYLEQAQKDHKTLPSLILLDLNMPVMSGEAFLAEQKSRPELRDIPVAVFTAAGGKVKPVLAEDFVRKPINLDDLLSLVKKYC